MRISQRWPSIIFAALLVLATSIPASEGRTCLMMYQMADNNLEFYIRQDYEELINSQVITSDNLRTWVYYDALNQGGQALPGTVDMAGNDLRGTFTGSRYITYDAAIGKMRVDVELPGEVNSDQKETVQGFLQHAMEDCVANGYTNMMAVFSSHGGGFAGFGGDENVRHRQLLQTNRALSSAIRSALDSTPGAPQKLDVVGFDACLMQAVGAADDYMNVAKYILASEAVEPGHGWAYKFLTDASSPLTLSNEILNTFLTQTQGSSSHQSPKTLSIVDSDKFGTFVDAFEGFSAELEKNLLEGDVSLHSFVSRARASAVAFEGIVDSVGTSNPSALDIGSFLQKFDSFCNPGGTLGTALQQTKTAYTNMFVAAGVGPGTAPGTGMHITWPHQGEYTANTGLWNQVLFHNDKFATAMIPNYQNFLQWFLVSEPPSPNGGQSVCNEGAEPVASLASTDVDALIISDTAAVDPATGFFHVETEIAPQVSQVLVEYGLDLSTPLKPVLVEKGYTPQDDEYLYLLGGDVAGDYSGSKFSASWDQNFYFLNITGGATKGNFEALYVFDEGDGSKKVPAMYFPESKREEVANLGFLDFLFFDFDFWVEQGARFSFLQFSVDEAVGRVNDNLALYVSESEHGFAEKPRNAGGLLIPLIYIDAYIQGRKLNTLPGGFNQTVIQWSSNLEYNILTTHATRIFDVIPDTDAVVMNMYAFNHGDPESEAEARYYDVIRKDRTGEVDFALPEEAYEGFGFSAASSTMTLSSRLMTLGLVMLSLVYQ